MVTQYLAYEAMGDSFACLSNWTAGSGQTSLGPDFRNKIDAMLALPWVRPDDNAPGVRLAHVQFDGLAFHRDRDHLPTCPRRSGGGRRKKKAAAAAASAAAAAERPTMQSIWRERMKKKKDGGGGENGDAAAAASAAAAAELDNRALVGRLAAALTAACAEAGLVILVTLDILHECEVFHDLANFDPAAALRHPAAPNIRLDPATGSRYGNLRKMMLDHHADTVVFGPPARLRRRGFTQEELVNRLMTSGMNKDGARDGGFVLLRGGHQPGQPGPEDNMGFLLQRTPTTVDQLGSFTRMQALRMNDGDVEATDRMLAKYCANEQTVCRRSYHRDGELVGADQYRFLKRDIGLEGETVQHFLHYTHNKALNPFLVGLLDRRHCNKKGKADPMLDVVLKLALNSCYGGAAMAATNFSRTTVMGERQLRKMKFVEGEHLLSLTLLGAICKPYEQPQLLYAVTKSQPRARIHNVLAMSACILSNSRLIFLGILHRLNSILCCTKAQLCYTGEPFFFFGIRLFSLQLFSYFRYRQRHLPTSR